MCRTTLGRLLRRSMQPPRGKPRRIVQPSRPERPLDYERLSDPILVKRFKDGDRQALATLCERHADKVVRLSRHLLGDNEDARDAAQESLAKLCVRLPQFRGESRFSTWLHRLVVNTCRDVAERQRLRRCERQPDVVVLKDAFDLSFEEISSLQGMPVGTAKCYAHRARARLRARLEAVERAV